MTALIWLISSNSLPDCICLSYLSYPAPVCCVLYFWSWFLTLSFYPDSASVWPVLTLSACLGFCLPVSILVKTRCLSQLPLEMYAWAPVCLCIVTAACSKLKNSFLYFNFYFTLKCVIMNLRKTEDPQLVVPKAPRVGLSLFNVCRKCSVAFSVLQLLVIFIIYSVIQNSSNDNMSCDLWTKQTQTAQSIFFKTYDLQIHHMFSVGCLCDSYWLCKPPTRASISYLKSLVLSTDAWDISNHDGPKTHNRSSSPNSFTTCQKSLSHSLTHDKTTAENMTVRLQRPTCVLNVRKSNRMKWCCIRSVTVGLQRSG